MKTTAVPNTALSTALAGWIACGALLVVAACEPVGGGGALQRSDALAPTSPDGDGATAEGQDSEPSAPQGPGTSPGDEGCLVPRAEPPPPKAPPATGCPSESSPAPSLPRGMVHFVDAPGAPGVAVEIAATSAAQARGLMYRTSLEEDGGMLFSWEYDAPRSFWMRNTCIPLDMLFIDASGRIAQILEQVPTLNDEPRRTACSVRHVLEVNAGWTRDHGVLPGQHVQLPKENN